MSFSVSQTTTLRQRKSIRSMVDESTLGYEALSKDKLYIKVEKNRSFLLYGDYHTKLNDTKLAALIRDPSTG